MGDSYLIKEGVEFLVLSSLVGLHSKNFAIKESLYTSPKFLKFVKNFKLVLQKIDPSEFTIIINKTHIVFFFSQLILVCRPPDIREQSSKGKEDTLEDFA